MIGCGIIKCDEEDMVETGTDLSPEYRLLAYCAQIEPNDRTKKALEEVLQDNLNWPYILQESVKQGITCLVYNNLLPVKDRIPESVWRELEGIYYSNTYRNIRISQDVSAILSAFNRENLKVIPLKGIFLAEKAYNNIALRGTTDIDLLVKKEDLPKIDKLLETLGYRTPIHKELLPLAIKKSYLNSMDYFKTAGLTPSLHIHWHITNAPLPTYMYSKNIKMNKFWECARPSKICDTETLQLSPHHLIMYLSEHALKHSFDRLILLADIDAVIKRYSEQIDWEALIKEAVEFGMSKQLFYGLYFTNYFLDTAIPAHVLIDPRLKKINFLERRFFRSIRSNRRNTGLSYFVYLAMIQGPANKLWFILRTVFPPPPTIALISNLDKPRVGIKDYLTFLKKQFSILKNI